MTRALGYGLTASWTTAVVVAVCMGQVRLTAGLLITAAAALVVWRYLLPDTDELGEHDGWEGHDQELATVTAPLPDHPVCLGCLTRPACRPEMACRSCQRSYMAARRQLQRRRPAAVGGAR